MFSRDCRVASEEPVSVATAKGGSVLRLDREEALGALLFHSRRPRWRPHEPNAGPPDLHLAKRRCPGSSIDIAILGRTA